MVALRSDISVGLTPDQVKRIRYQAITIVEMTESVPPRLHAILDGQPEGNMQFHELSGVGSIGDEKRGDLMAGFTKAPFYGAAYVKRGRLRQTQIRWPSVRCLPRGQRRLKEVRADLLASLLAF